MRIIEPSAEVWTQVDVTQHIARCARVCYKSEPKLPPYYLAHGESKEELLRRKDTKLLEMLVSSGHISMLRHATYYFLLPRNTGQTDKTLQSLYLCLDIRTKVYGGKSLRVNHGTLFAINGQSYYELSQKTQQQLQQYRVSENDFFGTDECHDFWPKRYLQVYRTTVSMVTQISTSRELNRVSPNNIAEQSTRYVNFGKRGGICICKPHWYDSASWLKKAFHRLCWRTQELMYDIALKCFHMRPEDARGLLPLDTATQVVYTYTTEQWRHIFDLRVRETTGRAHPNAKQVCSLAQQAINLRLSQFNPRVQV